MFPKHYSLKEDGDKHYTIHDSRDGSSFQVSKKELHPASQLKILKHLPKYAEGGSVFDNQPDVEPSNASPQGTTDLSSVGQATALMTPPPSQDVTPDQLATNQAQQQQAQSQYGQLATGPYQQMQAANALGNKAADEQFQAEKMKSEGMLDAQKAYESQLKDVMADHASRAAEANQRMNELFDAAQSGQIKPEDYWNKHSKVTSALAIVLGGLGAGLQGSTVNMALKTINEGIDREVDAQKANKAQKNNLYHMYLQKYNNDEDAYSRTKSDLLALTAAKTSQIAAQAGTPQAAAARDMMKHQLGMQAAQMNMQFAGANLSRQAISQGVPVEAMSLLPEKQREQMVRLPNGTMADAGSTANAKEFTEQTEAFEPLMGDLSELKRLNSVGTVLEPSQRERANVLQRHIVTQLNDLAKSHRISESDIGFQTGQLSNPNSIFNKLSTDWNAGTDQLMESLIRKYQSVGKNRVPALGNMMQKREQAQGSINFKAR